MIRIAFLSICLGVTAPLVAQSNQQQPPPVKIPYSGIATNVSLGVYDRVEMTISNPQAEIVHAEGTFAGETLVGTFRAVGQAVPYCAERMICLRFQGTLAGLEVGGFPDGMFTTWSMVMNIDAKGAAIATYVVGPLPSYDFSQSGIMQLKPATSQ